MSEGRKPRIRNATHGSFHGPGNETFIDFFVQTQTTSHHLFWGKFFVSSVRGKKYLSSLLENLQTYYVVLTNELFRWCNSHIASLQKLEKRETGLNFEDCQTIFLVRPFQQQTHASVLGATCVTVYHNCFHYFFHTCVNYEKYVSCLWPNGIIFHQPKFPWNRGHFPSSAIFWGEVVFSVAGIAQPSYKSNAWAWASHHSWHLKSPLNCKNFCWYTRNCRFM